MTANMDIPTKLENMSMFMTATPLTRIVDRIPVIHKLTIPSNTSQPAMIQPDPTLSIETNHLKTNPVAQAMMKPAIAPMIAEITPMMDTIFGMFDIFVLRN